MTEHVTLKHMEEYLDKLDSLHDEGKISIGEYIQIGISLKMTQILLELNTENMKPYKYHV